MKPRACSGSASSLREESCRHKEENKMHCGHLRAGPTTTMPCRFNLVSRLALALDHSREDEQQCLLHSSVSLKHSSAETNKRARSQTAATISVVLAMGVVRNHLVCVSSLLPVSVSRGTHATRATPNINSKTSLRLSSLRVRAQVVQFRVCAEGRGLE